MKINEFKKLEKKIVGQNFGESYKGINVMMTILSYFGNLVSIFLAYFFMSMVIGSAVDSPVAIFISSIIILTGIELLKRDIFDKFSISYLKEKTLANATLPLFLFSFLLISASFYSTLNGAKEFSSKSVQMDEIKDNMVKIYTDSLTIVYSGKISSIEEEIKGYKLKIDEKDAEQALINQSLQDKGYLSKSEKDRNKQLTEEKKYLDDKVDKSEVKIDELKKGKESEISSYEKELTEKTDSKKEDNSKNSFIFIIISTIIEFVILGGVFFNEYYKFRSYKEFRDKIDKDPNYQKWMLYEEILNVVYTEETKVNQKLPSNKAIIEMCKANSLFILPRDIIDFIRLLNNINIIRISGSAKYFGKQKDVAFEILKRHFNIE